MALVLNGSDTSAGDDAGLGYTSAEGIIITGQGSTSDVTIKNDADTTVFSIPTGTANVLFPDGAKALFGAGSDLQIYHNGSNSYIDEGGTGALIFKSNTYSFRNAADSEQIILASEDGAINLYHNNSSKLATASTGVDIDGQLAVGTTSPNAKAQVHSAALGTTAGNSQDILQLHSPDTNNNTIYRFHTFRTANGDDHNSSEGRFQRKVDVTEQGYIGFRADNITFGYGTTERMRIVQDGKVGIGLTNPTGQFAVSDGTRIAEINPHSSGTFIGNRSNHAVLFQVNASEKMRIDTGGNLLVGTTNTSLGIGNTNTGFQVENNGTFLASRADNIAGSLNRNNDGSILSLRRSGNEVGTIGVTSSSTSYNTSSDYRLKENVDYSWNATTRLKQLKPARFNFISDPDITVDGFIAHEAQDVVPHAVTGKKDAEEMQAIDQSKLVPLLVKAMQEQQTVIEALEARISTLEGS